MDIFPIKHKAFTDVTLDVQKNKGAMPGGFSIKFEDMLAKAGGQISLNGDVNALAGRSNLTNAKERVERPAASEKKNFESRDEAPRVEQRDDSGREQHAKIKDTRENDGDGHQQKQEDAPRDRDNGPKTAAGKDDGDNAKSKEAAGSDDKAPEETSSVSAKASAQDNKVGGQSDKVENNRGDSVEQHAEEVIAGLIVAAQNATVAGQVTDQASNSEDEGSQEQVSAEGLPLVVADVGRQNSVEGLSSALAAVGKQNSVKSGDNAILQVSPGGQQAQADVAGNADAQAQGNNQEQQQLPQQQVNAQAAVKDANPVNAANTMTQQAAGLAKMIGEGNRLAVNVNVVNEAATVVSQPAAVLTSSTLLSDDGADRQQSGQPSLQNQVATTMTTAAAGVQTQNQNQQASIQNQTVSTAGTEAKGPVQAAPSANAGGLQAQAAGGENMPVAGQSAPGETSQTFKSAATAQANNAHHVNTPRHTVIDQVSVQITKAVNDGVDRINIQLRPENLGRVDVRLEVGHDGRTQAVVIVDNKDTMELLQRDAKDLQRALEEAGLKLENDGLSFSLRGQKGRDGGEKDNAHGAGNAADIDEDEDAELIDRNIPVAAYEGGVREDGRVDIRA